MDPSFQVFIDLFNDLKSFYRELFRFIIINFKIQFIKFEDKKGTFASLLYRKRGKMAHNLTHSGMAGLVALGVAIAPIVAQEFPGRIVDPWGQETGLSKVLSLTTEDPETTTFISDQRDKIIDYTVVEGDTVSSISEKFDISTDTIRWQNNLKSKDSIKVGQVLQILPVTGVSHKVQKGESVYSIAKKYDTEAQNIVNFPFNTYSNDETFDLAIGQTIIVPDGIKPEEIPWSPNYAIRQVTPNAGSVTPTGLFVWPSNGIITQRFIWYHKGIDIANRAGPNILAADSGRVVVAGWPDNYGYGNRVIIDHGNGYRTLYAHMAKIYVVVGQTVNRGDVLGTMGSTGRSTGTHLHFEISKGGVHINPLTVLK